MNYGAQKRRLSGFNDKTLTNHTSQKGIEKHYPCVHIKNQEERYYSFPPDLLILANKTIIAITILKNKNRNSSFLRKKSYF